jgi:3-oxoacyl-[acyl-carrier-protein] synthase II
MIPVSIIAAAAESALGSGPRAYDIPPVGERAATAIHDDPVLRASGMRYPFVARARCPVLPGQDRASALLARASASLLVELDQRRPTWRSGRTGLVLGTSSGGMLPLTACFERIARGQSLEPGDARAAPYFAPMDVVDTVLGVTFVERMQVLAACASSAFAIGLASRWLECGYVDLCICGGYDAVGLLVASGFEAIGATTATRPAPFRLGRDGMSLGEGAALLALANDEGRSRPLGYVRGFGATSDAIHVTAPDREGRGLAAAATLALEDAAIDPSVVDLVSAHATATPFNDAAEARALAAVLGPRLDEVPVHPYKAVIGHTLGASSALEILAAISACRAGVLPAAAGEGQVDPDAAVRLLRASEAGSPRTILDLSAAFGGANAALVVGLDPGFGSGRARHGVDIAAVGDRVEGLKVEDLVRQGLVVPERSLRLDPASELAVAAAASALERLGTTLPERTAVVVATATASVENDGIFARRLWDRGPTGVQPRGFPATSPNLPAAQVGILFGYRGPQLATGCGALAPLEGMRLGYDLIRCGDADAALVLSVEHVGEYADALWRSGGMAAMKAGALGVVLVPTSGHGIPRETIARHWRELGTEGSAFREEPFDAALLLQTAAREVMR